MFRRRPAKPESAAFAQLPVQHYTTSTCRHVAVHASGDFGAGLLPLVCLAGYNRNMADFTAFMQAIRGATGANWPFILIDMPGRGRSAPLKDPNAYSTLTDAQTVGDVLSAMNIHTAMFVGQGHGGQIIMALALSRISLISAAALIDAGPVADPRGLVRLRNNLAYLQAFRGTPSEAEAALVQLHMNDYPGLERADVAAISLRTHLITQKGRILPLYDTALGTRLNDFTADDALEPQWPLFLALNHMPIMLIRTQYSDLLRRETFEEMCRQRPDAIALTISGQGSPALLDGLEETGIMTAFLDHLTTGAQQKRNAA